MGGKPGLAVVILNRKRRPRLGAARLRGVLFAAADALGVSGELALVLTGDRALQTLNARYRGKREPTDVLSFPGACAGHAEPGARRCRAACEACQRGAAELGDIVISVETAARNARALGRTLPQELDVLALHGLLHLLGYDHETDDGTMRRLEQRLRRWLLPLEAAPAPAPPGAARQARPSRRMIAGGRRP